MSNVRDDFDRASEPSGNSRGCLFGCLIGAGIMIALLLCAGGVTYWYASSLIANYTSETPNELPQVDYTAEQMADLDSRLESFNSGVNADGEPAPTELVMTADDINAMLSKNKDIKGKIYVQIEDGEITGDVSIPLAGFIPGGKGRYFNGSVGLKVSMVNDVLFVTLTSAEVNGEPVPEQVVDQIGSENLAKDAYKQNGEALRRLEDVRIEGDKLIVKLKASSDDAESETETSESETRDVDEPIDEAALSSELEPAGV